MSDRERLRREDPARTGPYRSWSTLFGPPAPGEPGRGPSTGEGPAPGPGGEWSDVVSRGVELGYRVLEEQVRQGQRVAEQMATQSYGPSAMARETQEIGERLLRSSADALALWFELLTSVFGRGDVFRSLAPDARRAAGTTGLPASRVSVEVASVRPARVTVDLQPGAAGRRLVVHGLRAMDAAIPPLTDVAFDADPSGEIVGVRVRVPDDLPPGVYAGVVLDRETGEPRGTLSVRIPT
jgi:hypothetical protein